MDFSLLETFKKKSMAAINNIGVAASCILPGAAKSIEQPVMDAIDIGTMATGGNLEAEGRTGLLTNLARDVADDRQYDGKGELEDACDAGQFIGGTATALLTGGALLKAGSKLGVNQLKRKLMDRVVRSGRELEQDAPAGRKALSWAWDRTKEFTIGTVAPGVVAGAGVVAKEYYREEHPAPGPIPPPPR